MVEKRPSDINGQLFSNDHERKQVSVSASSPKLDEGVRTIENKVRTGQDLINEWRIRIVKNEQAIIISCLLFGVLIAYAVNECTGDFDFPGYAYWMAGVIVFLLSLLLISGGSLPLIILIKFATSMVSGHLAMMFLIAIDGHGFGFFTTDTCRYPVTFDSITGCLFGVGIGYIAATFKVEER